MAPASRIATLCARQLRQPTSRLLLKPEYIRQCSPTARRIAPFSTTIHRQIFPPGPQVIKGGVNDPAPIPHPNSLHGSTHWIAERAISVALIPLTLAPFAAGSLNPTTDAVFCALLLAHSHFGFQAAITDYFPNWSMPFWRKTMDWVLLAATLAVGVGLYEFETNDVGITEAAKRIWRAGAENDATIKAADPQGGALGHDGKLKHLTN